MENQEATTFSGNLKAMSSSLSLSSMFSFLSEPISIAKFLITETTLPVCEID